MAINESTGTRTAKLSGGVVPALPAGSILEIRSGARPTSANDAPTGTVLVTITLPATPWGAVAEGTVSKNGTWSASATAAGTAGWARLRTSTDGGLASTTAVRLDYVVAQGSGDLSLDNVSIASGQTVTLTTFSING